MRICRQDVAGVGGVVMATGGEDVPGNRRMIPTFRSGGACKIAMDHGPEKGSISAGQVEGAGFAAGCAGCEPLDFGDGSGHAAFLLTRRRDARHT